MHRPLQDFADTADILLLVLDDQARIRNSNPFTSEITGHTIEEMIGEDWIELLIPLEDQEDVRQAFSEHLANGDDQWEKQQTIVCKDGTMRTIQWKNSFSLDSSDKSTFVISLGIDITEIVDTLERSKGDVRQYRTLLDSVPLNIYQKGSDLNYLFCNKSYAEELGKPVDEIIGTSDLEHFPSEIGQTMLEKDKEILASGETLDDETWVYYPNGRLILLHTFRTPVRDTEGEIRGVIGISRDITAQWRAEQRIKEQSEALLHQANHDGLTSLPNRTLLYDRLTKAISKSNREKDHFALLFLDLDQFKQINDIFGHSKGNAVLRQVASRLSSLIRSEDTLSRLGGDEFVIILEKLHRPQHASVLAEKIIHALQKPILDGEQEIYLTTSIGISVFPKDGEDADQLLKNADAAMYKAKDMGRNNYQFYDAEMARVARERIMMESDLRRAIKKDELVLFYQPKIDLTNDRIEGFEVLLRWQHPTHGLIPPSMFLPFAEESGMIVEIGEYVLEKAVRQLKEWQKSFGDVGHISINISARQLQHRDFFERFVAILEIHACPADKVLLEISEDQISSDPKRNIPVLKRFIEHGVKIAIDDFGKGNAQLNFLKQLPFDQLKIDQSSIQAFPADIAITKAILDVAKSLRVGVIAKGVETLEQSKTLKEEGYAEAQGFHYGRPINAESTEELIRSRAYA